jgi:hypothetical protein
MMFLGTTHFYDDPSQPQTATEQDTARLKCDTSGKIPIILVRALLGPSCGY